MNKVAVIGAGKTGRGFIARLLAEGGCSILFIDKNEQLVKKLNEQNSYLISFFGQERPDYKIANYKAVTWQQADLKDIELIFVSVGGTNLKEVGAHLKKLLSDGKKRYIITCENATHPAKTLLDAISIDEVSVSEATVFCSTLENQDIDIYSENYPYLQCDAMPLKGCAIPTEGIRPIEGFGNFLTRKLFTYNAASCVIAYLGYVKGYESYGDAANDPEINTLLDRNYAATNRVLCQEYGYDPKDQDEFARLSKQKFCNKTIADTIARNAREPQRKLEKGERVMGPLMLLHRYGEDTSVLVMTAAAMLLYRNEKEEIWQQIVDSNTPEQILEKIGGLECDSPLTREILKKREELKNYMDKKMGDKL